jgi:hypothetical protein
MNDIIKYDVRTYVQELMKKEFPSKNNKEKVFSENRETDTGGHRKVQPPYAAIISNVRTASGFGV